MEHAYRAAIAWDRGGAAFTDGRYSREHRWLFDEGVEVLASSSPLSVRPPLSRADAVDPEEALVAAAASCHMLFFLAFAAKAGLVVESYRDQATGTMTRNARGKLFLSEIRLDPAIVFAGRQPSADELAQLHERSHDECYVAHSLRAEIRVAGLAHASA